MVKISLFDTILALKRAHWVYWLHCLVLGGIAGILEHGLEPPGHGLYQELQVGAVLHPLDPQHSNFMLQTADICNCSLMFLRGIPALCSSIATLLSSREKCLPQACCCVCVRCSTDQSTQRSYFRLPAPPPKTLAIWKIMDQS